MTRALKGRATKALVLAAGRGTRMRAGRSDAHLTPAQAAAADRGVKGMIPVGRPFLDHVLHSLAEAGFTDIGLVIAPHHADVRTYYTGIELSRIQITFITQLEPLGTADAVLAAETWVAGEPFITLNSDNLYPVDVLSALRDAGGPAVPGFERDALALPLDRIGAYALIECDARNCLSRIGEKPGRAAVEAAGADALISMNVWRFDARIFGACRDVAVSSRGEQELPQAVGLAASRGVCFEVMPVRGEVLDLSQRADIAHVAQRLEGAVVKL
ncbi:MAG: sugar phosphate nucleotidyltransferase [Vicinamibacterales bacterium]